MQMKELLDRLDSEEEPYYGNDLVEEVMSYGGYCDLSEHGFTCRAITRWYCTDTHVGMTAIYYKGELIAVSEQQGRKCDVTFHWASQEVYGRIRRIVEDLCREDDPPSVNMINWDRDVGDPVYSVNYSGQVLWHGPHREGIYQGRTVEVLGDAEPKNFISSNLRVRDGEHEKVVPVNEVFFQVKLKDQA